MPVSQLGAINTTALIVPDIYVQIVPPAIALLNGVPTNILGVVGTAQWGPVNAPTIVGSMPDYARNFGAIQARKYDMGTQVACSVLQGANNFRCVRVTDGTDVAATTTVGTNGLTVTAKYTGTLGNSLQVTLAAGSAATSWKVVVSIPGQTPETFDNLAAGLTGNAVWVAIAAAINSGISGLRGPSGLIVAAAGVGTAAPTAGTTTLTGGTDGAGTITGASLVGVDTVPRKGMYALRNTGASIGVLCDCDDTTTFSTQVAYGYAEGTYMVGVTPAGDTIANAVSTKATAGIDAYIFKYLLGDWVYFLDNANGGIVRLVSPQGYIAGRLANLAPQESSLNKPLYGVVGTQKSYQNLVYSNAELQALAQAGIDLITNPIPAGNSFGARFGHNSASAQTVHGDNYTRMTNYLAYTFNSAGGQFVGRLQSVQPTDPLRRECKAFFDNFLGAMQGQNQIDDFQVQCDLGNNTPTRIGGGNLQADVKVRYLAVVENFLVNLQGGQTVEVIRQQTSAAK